MAKISGGVKLGHLHHQKTRALLEPRTRRHHQRGTLAVWHSINAQKRDKRATLRDWATPTLANPTLAKTKFGQFLAAPFGQLWLFARGWVVWRGGGEEGTRERAVLGEGGRSFGEGGSGERRRVQNLGQFPRPMLQLGRCHGPKQKTLILAKLAQIVWPNLVRPNLVKPNMFLNKLGLA